MTFEFEPKTKMKKPTKEMKETKKLKKDLPILKIWGIKTKPDKSLDNK